MEHMALYVTKRLKPMGCQCCVKTAVSQDCVLGTLWGVTSLHSGVETQRPGLQPVRGWGPDPELGMSLGLRKCSAPKVKTRVQTKGCKLRLGKTKNKTKQKST